MRRNTSSPPGRSSRAASGTIQVRVGPDRRRRSRRRRGRSTRPAAAPPRRSRGRAGTRRRLAPSARARARAAARSCRAPTDPRAAPRRARIDQYAVPQPSSSTSLPVDVAEDAELGLRQLPHAPARLVLAPDALARLRSWYSSLRTASQAARLCSTSRQTRLIGEPERDLARGRLRRVGAVHEVVRHREREVAADRARRRVGRVRRAHRRAHDRDRALALEHERERRRRGDERRRARRRTASPRARRSAARASSRSTVTSSRAARIDEAARLEAARGSRRRARAPTASGLIRTSVRSTAMRRRSLLVAGQRSACLDAADRARLRAIELSAAAHRVLDASGDDRRLAVRAHLPERLERRLAARAGLLQLRRADRADEELGLDRRRGRPGSAASRRPSRSSIARISSSRSRTSSRYSGGRKKHVDERAEERRHEPEQRRHRDQPRILDPPARVLVDPVRAASQKTTDEEDRRGSGSRATCRS